MLKCYLERPAHRRADCSVFADTQIWEAGGGSYRDEYARYPVITLDFSAAARCGTDASTTMRGVLERECARLLPLLDARICSDASCAMSNELRVVWRTMPRLILCSAHS